MAAAKTTKATKAKTQIPAGAKRPQDHRPASVKTDIEQADLAVTYDGHDYTIGYDRLNDIELIEAFGRIEDADGDGLGHWVVYRGAVTEQAPVRLDFAAGSASQGGDRTQLVTGRGWWSVPPGGQVQPVVESLQQGTTCRCDITIYDTYI